MLDHLKKYAGMHLAIVVTVAGIIAQSGQHYLTTHPQATAAGFFGACGLAIVNFFLISPFSKQS